MNPTLQALQGSRSGEGNEGPLVGVDDMSRQLVVISETKDSTDM